MRALVGAGADNDGASLNLTCRRLELKTRITSSGQRLDRYALADRRPEPVGIAFEIGDDLGFGQAVAADRVLAAALTDRALTRDRLRLHHRISAVDEGRAEILEPLAPLGQHLVSFRLVLRHAATVVRQ